MNKKNNYEKSTGLESYYLKRLRLIINSLLKKSVDENLPAFILDAW